MTIFNNNHFKNHTAVHYFFNQPSGLRAIIAIHSLGSANCAIGGARMYPYATEDEALSDALNLSQGMSLKSAMAQLPYGGAKAVIIGDPKKDKTPGLLAAFADCVDSLKGTYKTSEDIGINLEDPRFSPRPVRMLLVLEKKRSSPQSLPASAYLPVSRLLVNIAMPTTASMGKPLLFKVSVKSVCTFAKDFTKTEHL